MAKNAVYLEVQDDACFQSGLYKALGMRRAGWFLVLVYYSLLLNTSKVDFGKLLGVYVVLFFLVAQIGGDSGNTPFLRASAAVHLRSIPR